MLHGIYLIINHALRHLLGGRSNLILRLGGACATFLAVVVAWVFFRATSVGVAVDVLHAMFGGTLTPAMRGTVLGINRIMELGTCLWWLGACAAIVFFLPNAYDLLGRGLRLEQENRLEGRCGNLLMGAMLLLCLFLLSISETRGVSEFLYFNF
ncbi:hypothetical protein [Janthinobacterium sp. LB2P10]|uniref:hypothetical protein n=1 Tax=Janthinobacterium sp. LB2P10 TaxID=3424194 RepID=UPI003F1F910B